jgi:phospholipid-binding lipoprotein MlaA
MKKQKGAKPVKKLLAAAIMLVFFSIVCFCTPALAADREPGVYLAQQSQEAEAEEDEEYEDDDEYEDDVVQINDPLHQLNRDIFWFNDSLYIILIRPAAKAYNKVIPVEIRTCVKNFFYNLRFPIRFVNCLLQAKGIKATEEFATFLLNSTVGFAGIGDVASHYDNLPPSPEDLGQTLAVWGLGNGFFIMYPIFGPYTLRDSARFIDGFFLDPVSWLRYNEFGGYSSRTRYAILAYDEFNQISFKIDDIDAMKEAVLDPYVAIRDAYIEHRNKLIAE